VARFQYTQFATSVRIQMPSASEQGAIAETLNVLDDKIELNRRMNETLETMARAIFKDWFVDFGPTRAKIEGKLPYLATALWRLFPDKLDHNGRPEGWKLQGLAEIANITSGKRPELRVDRHTPDAAVPVYGGAGPMAFTTRPLYTSPLLITGRVGTLGVVHRVSFPVWPSDNTLLVLPLSKQSFELIYFVLGEADIHALNRGSTQPLVTQGDLGKTSALIPSDALLRHFSSVVGTLFECIDHNLAESSALVQTRDLLLPKLMSGEIRVKDAEKVLAEVA
jgi:type I restriction enzyme, S subunit